MNDLDSQEYDPKQAPKGIEGGESHEGRVKCTEGSQKAAASRFLRMMKAQMTQEDDQPLQRPEKSTTQAVKAIKTC